MQQLPTFNFGLSKFFFFIYRTLSMRQKTKNYRIKGSNTKFFYIFLFSKSHTHMGLVCAKMRAKNSHAWAPLRLKVKKCILHGLWKRCKQEVYYFYNTKLKKMWRTISALTLLNGLVLNIGLWSTKGWNISSSYLVIVIDKWY
jgi:hypothetical protein